MQHVESVEINASLVQRLIASQFSQWADLPVTLIEPNGWDNRTFRLGADMSVRLPSHQAYAAQVHKEHQWLRTLAPQLPLAIPTALELGVPEFGYPWGWAVNRWIDGETAESSEANDSSGLALALADFLKALHRIQPADGPLAGEHNFFRGGPLATYDAQTRAAIAALDGAIDPAAATAVWEAALESSWRGPPVWVHGDINAPNLLVRDGRLVAVIDFGCCGVGDPSCDLTIAWTCFRGGSRRTFRDALVLDEDTWIRARGWALWKALITIAELDGANSAHAAASARVLDSISGGDE